MSSDPSVQERLRAWAYAFGPGRYYQPAYHHIATAIGLESGAFLDVGCGPGWLAIHVAAGHSELDAVGIDTSARMIAFAKRNRAHRLNTTFHEMDGAEIIYPPSTFDAAAAVQSAHHWTDPSAVLSEVFRVLRPGGRFYIYEADSDRDAVPQGWVQRRGLWPPDALVLRNWRRWGMGSDAWGALKGHVSASPFGGGEDGQHGFYRRLVLTKAG